MTFSALALTAAGALIAELTHANVQERMVRSDNPLDFYNLCTTDLLKRSNY